MKITMSNSQRRALSQFFNNIAVAWFAGLFIVPSLSSDFNFLTVLKFVGNMVGALILSLILVREDANL